VPVLSNFVNLLRKIVGYSIFSEDGICVPIPASFVDVIVHPPSPLRQGAGGALSNAAIRPSLCPSSKRCILGFLFVFFSLFVQTTV